MPPLWAQGIQNEHHFAYRLTEPFWCPHATVTLEIQPWVTTLGKWAEGSGTAEEKSVVSDGQVARSCQPLYTATRMHVLQYGFGCCSIWNKEENFGSIRERLCEV